MSERHQLYVAIGERVRRIRETQTPRMSQEDLAQVLGLSRTSVTNIERGNQKPTLDTLYRLCEHFGLEIDQVLPRVGDLSRDEGQSVHIGGKSLEVGAKTADLLSRLRSPSRGRR